MMIQNGVPVPDDFRHEQYLLIVEHGRRILLSGCSHRGILRIAEQFSPDVLIGGFHLSKLFPGEALSVYTDELSRRDTAFYTCHCTGVGQYEWMKQRMNRLSYLHTGETVTL